MSKLTLILLIRSVLSTTPHNPLVTENLLLAFATVENASYNPNTLGDNGKAWGLFQFHRDRWIESTGKAEEWGKASAEKQIRVMIQALNNYLKSNKKKIDTLRWCGTFHNIGNGKNLETQYVKKLRKHYKILITTGKKKRRSSNEISTKILVEPRPRNYSCKVA